MNANFKKNNPLFRNLQSAKGFTLLEMLVSISIFMIVMLVASSALLSIIDANQKAQSLKSAINNLNFALESMHKSIRVGSNYSGGAVNCLPPDSCIEFFSSKDLNGNGSIYPNDTSDVVVYKYDSGSQSIKRCQSTSIHTCNFSDSDTFFIPMTSGEVKITDMKFYISNISSTPQRVLITISGYAGPKEKTQTKFNLQTTVSQRSF